MTNSIQRDQKRRLLFSKFEIKRKVLKTIIRDFHLPQDLRFQSIQELNRISRNSSLTRIKNRCVQTGRAKANLRFFKISRITFRELASKGLLPGVTKSSW
jgi:ribosomal protein S14